MTSKVMTSLDRVKEILESQLELLDAECAFSIEVKDNNSIYNPEDLIRDEEIRGVLTAPNTIYSSANDGTEQLQCELHFIVPLESSINSSATATLNTLIRDINNKEFSIEGVEQTFIITGAQVLTASKLEGAIEGDEYEEVIITFQVFISKNFIRSENEKIEIENPEIPNIYLPINGKIAINTLYQKTCDGHVYNGSPLQKNAVNGIQMAITVDFIMFKDDPIHQLLLKSAREIRTHKIRYFDGYEKLIYDKAMITSLETTAVSGDIKKAKATIVLAK